MHFRKDCIKLWSYLLLTVTILRMGKVQIEDNVTKEEKTEYSLVRVKGTWTRKLGKKVNKDKVDCVSAAKM